MPLKNCKTTVQKQIQTNEQTNIIFLVIKWDDLHNFKAFFVHFISDVTVVVMPFFCSLTSEVTCRYL